MRNEIADWVLKNCKFAAPMMPRKKFEDNPVVNPAQPIPPMAPAGTGPVQPVGAAPQAPKPQGFVPMNSNPNRAKMFQDIQQNVQPTPPAWLPQPQAKPKVSDPFEAFRQQKLKESPAGPGGKPVKPLNMRNKP